MQNARGNLWTYPADWLCITTNGATRSSGAAVMGAGCAREARDRFPGIAERLGALLASKGSHVHYLGRATLAGAPAAERLLFSFPVKHHWKEHADPGLIERSCAELVVLWERALQQTLGQDHGRRDEAPVVALPRPGCGHGRLSYARDVEPILQQALPGPAFHIITFARR